MSINMFRINSVLLSLAIGLTLSLSFCQSALANDGAESTELSSQESESAKQVVDQSNPYLMVQGAADQTFKRFAREQQALSLIHI